MAKYNVKGNLLLFSGTNLEKMTVQNEAKEHEANDLVSDRVDLLVMRDIKKQMLKITDEQPITNAGSFAMTLLWQIFEEASEHFEEWESMDSYNDEHIEDCFKAAFPEFIAGYPEVMDLDA